MSKLNLNYEENIKKVPTLEELYAELKKYSIILDGEVIKYLESLVNLELSALRRDVLNDEERKMLSEISLYRKVTIYNIYHRALEELEKQKEKYRINIINNGNDYDGIIALGITPLEDTFSIFDYHYSTSEPFIKLYEYQENQTQREKEMDSILDELNLLYEEKSPYYNRRLMNKGLYFKWKKEHERKIYELEEQFSKLDRRKGMPEEEKYKAEVKNYIAGIFEEDYGICPKKDYVDRNNNSYRFDRKNHIVKELSCDYPTLTLKKEIKYY